MKEHNLAFVMALKQIKVVMMIIVTTKVRGATDKKKQSLRVCIPILIVSKRNWSM
jgi:hypothetical protein